MNAAHRSVQLDALGGMLAVIGGAFMSVGAVLTAGSHQDVWSSPWFDGGSAVVVVGFALVLLAIVPWSRAWRRHRPSALLLLPGSEDWHLFHDLVWGVGLAVHMINRTGDPITITQYDLLDGSGVRQHSPVTEKSRQDVSDWIARISSDHRSELFTGELTIPPRGSVTRWFINSAYALRNGGRPHLILQIKDALNNTYEMNVPARPAMVYHPRTDIGD